MNADPPVLLPVSPLGELRKRLSAKWQTYPADVLPLTVAEMDFDLAAPVAEALQEAIGRSDAGYAMPGPGLGRALAGFAGRRWDWEVDPASVTAVTDVGVGVVELIRLLARAGDAVVISPPVYPPFFDWVRESRARLLEVPLAHDAAGWRLDLAALEAAFAAGRAGPYRGRAGRAGPARAGPSGHRDQRRDPRPAGAARRHVHPAADRARCRRGRGQPAVGQQGLEPGRPEMCRRRHRRATHGGAGRPVPARHPVARRAPRRHRHGRRVHRRGTLARPAARHPRPPPGPAGRAAARAPAHAGLGPARGDLPRVARLHGARPRQPGP